MHNDAIGTLTVQVARHGDKYAWKLYSDGHYQPIKFSVPIFLSEDAAHAAGQDVRARYLVVALGALGSEAAENQASFRNRGRLDGGP